MKYNLDFSPGVDVASPAVSGAVVSAEFPPGFRAWQPSTWPASPAAVDENFIYVLKRIFEESILGEIANVIADAEKVNGDLQHRGHVVAIALMCALDAISSYGYRGRHVSGFMKSQFPVRYHPYADGIYKVHRCSLVHSWNLFEAAIYPDDTPVASRNGSIAFGLLDFFGALIEATQNFLESLEFDEKLKKNTLRRYKQLRNSAKP